MKMLLLSLVLLLLQSSCIAQEESYKRERSNIHKSIEMQAFFQKENPAMGDTVILQVHITNIGDSAIMVYKDAVLAIERHAHPNAFGESMNILKEPGTLLQDKELQGDEALIFEVPVPIESPVFYKGKLKGLFFNYIKPHDKTIDLLECPLEEIIVL